MSVQWLVGGWEAFAANRPSPTSLGGASDSQSAGGILLSPILRRQGGCTVGGGVIQSGGEAADPVNGLCVDQERRMTLAFHRAILSAWMKGQGHTPLLIDAETV